MLAQLRGGLARLRPLGTHLFLRLRFTHDSRAHLHAFQAESRIELRFDSFITLVDLARLILTLRLRHHFLRIFKIKLKGAIIMLCQVPVAKVLELILNGRQIRHRSDLIIIAASLRIKVELKWLRALHVPCLIQLLFLKLLESHLGIRHGSRVRPGRQHVLLVLLI